MTALTLERMLSLMGFVTIAVILALLLANRVAAVVALAGVPVVTALLAGLSPTEIGEYVAGGLGGVVGTVAMFVFAIVYFGVMRDAGMFDPIIRRIVAFAGNAPVTVCLATTMLAMAAHLDGAGATTFLITIPAMLPLYDRLGMSRLTLTTCVGLGAGVMNILPWGGPTARAATTSGVPANELWVPLIPAQVVGMLTCLAIAWFLGRRETRRLASSTETVTVSSGGTAALGGSPVGHSDTATATSPDPTLSLSEEDRALRRPRLFWFNVLLTLLAIAALISAVTTPELIFLIAVVIALMVNYPGLHAQTDRIEAHAKGAMLMATTLLAAGVFLGILEGSGMIEAMAKSATDVLPGGAAPALPLIVGVLAVPMSLVFGPDPFYFGVLPVLIGIGEVAGVSAADISQAAIIGEETLGFPISPLTGSFYLLVGLGGVEIGKHIRALLGWAWLVSLVMLAVAFVTGVIPVWAG
ncbi:CitMHS family transporter [Nocardioides insulae]|uniref:CitMHS family transporter n=1 Tax=Nocardioides insulae TaxID=394734 RepID=UPI0004220F1A|nr:citrate:proton symporter [Nocardioides insulae]